MARFVAVRAGKISVTAVLVLAGGVVVGAAGTIAVQKYLLPMLEPKASTTGAALPKHNITALGRIQPTAGVLPLFAQPGEQIADVRLKQGAKVAKDDVICVLESHALRELEVRLAESQKKAADDQLAAIRKTRDAKLTEVDAEIEQLKMARTKDAAAQRAKVNVVMQQLNAAIKMRDSLVTLQNMNVSIAGEEIEKAKLQVEAAKAELEAEQAILDKAQSAVSGGDGLAKAKRDAAVAEFDRSERLVPAESAAIQLELARKKLEMSLIKAPAAGVLIKLDANKGDTAGQKPIAYVADPAKISVIAEVYESDVPALLAALEGGQSVECRVTSPTLGDGTTLIGKLTSKDQMAGMISRNALFALNPREDMDRRVVEVRVDLDAESSAKVSRFIGLQVKAEFQVAK